MTYYDDLSRYEYSESDREMLNVGWLAAGREYSTGVVPGPVVSKLLIMAADKENIMRGVHNCEFCEEESPLRMPAPVERGYVSLGMGELHVEGTDGRIYSAPSLVIHYIVEHQYAPPAEFQEAVLRSVG